MLDKIKFFLKSKLFGEYYSWLVKVRVGGIGLLSAYLIDFANYNNNACIGFGRFSNKNLRALIMKDSHRIEKALSLPMTRPFFGASVVSRLQKLIEKYIEEYNRDFYSDYGIGALRQYLLKHEKCINDIRHPRLLRIKKFCDSFDSGSSCENVGVDAMTKDQFFSDSDSAFRKFVASRRSIRNFTGKVIGKEVIKEAVSIAKSFPSVCNRQSIELFYFNDQEFVEKILKLQNGNSGFGYSVGGVAIITTIVDEFEGPGERNQMYIDGGIFLMNFLLSLHHLKVGACALNWSVTPGKDKKLKNLIQLDNSNTIISLVGVGDVNNDINVACSPRKISEDIYKNYM